MQRFYKVHFELQKKGSSRVLFSLPRTNEYQEIKNLIAHPKPTKPIPDEWGNEVATFRLNDVIKTTISFSYQPKKINKKISQRMTINDYRRNSKDLLNNPNRFINGNDKRIKTMAQFVVQRDKKLSQIIYKLYRFTLDYLSYGKPIEGLHPYSQALEEKVTDCGGFSLFLLSLFQSIGIPGRLVVGFLLKENLYTKLFSRFDFCLLTFDFFFMHAWLEVLLPDGSWFPLDPSIEWRRKHGQTKRQGGFGLIPADRLVTSFGQDFSIRIGGKTYRIDLLQHPVYL